ncbi:MAG: hypothetical protein ACRDE7_00160 [Sphingobacterium sp.]
MAELKVTLEGDASGLTKALDKATASVAKWSNQVDKDTQDASRAFARTASQVTTSIDRASASLSKGFGRGIIAPGLYKDLRLLDKELESVTITAERAAPALNRLGASQGASVKSTRRNSQSMIELSRVLGDLPYGIRGVANNLQQLAVVSGASTAAIFGITAVTAAFDFASRSIDRFIAEAGGLGPALLKITGNISATEASIIKFNRAVDEAGASVEGEIAQLNSLVKIIGDTTKSYNERNNALVVAVSEHKALEGALSLESVASGAARVAIDKYTDSLRNMAKVKAAVTLINETFAKVVKAENADVIESANTFDFLAAALTGGATAGGAFFDLMQRGAKRNKKEVGKLNAEVDRLVKYLDRLNSDAAEAGTLPGLPDALAGSAKKAAKDTRKEFEPISTDLTNSITRSAEIMTNGLKTAIGEFDKGLQKSADRFATAFPKDFVRFLQNPEGFIPSETRGIIQPNLRGPKGSIIKPDTEEVNNVWEQLAEDMRSNMSGSIQSLGSELTSVFRELELTGRSAFTNIMDGLRVSLNAALQNTVQSIASSVGSKVGASVGESVGNSVSKSLGDTVGGILGPGLGTLVGGVITGIGSLIGGLFGRGKRKREAEKQAEIQRKQLQEQQRMAKELERQSALAYTSSIIGKMLPGFGSVSNIDINSMGELTARVDGKDLLFVLGRAEGAKKRGV